MWLETELKRLLRDLLGVPDEVVRTDIAHHREIWTEICGRYRLPPGSPTCAGVWRYPQESRCSLAAATW
jgi:hypothetical protein